MKTYKFKIGGNDYEVEIGKIEGKTADVTVNGVSYQVEMENAPAAPAAPVAAAPVAAAAPAAQVAAPAAPAAKPAGEGKSVTSPLPGVIIEISVKEGQAVKAGQKVAVLEAMKMENEIAAPADGVVTSIRVSKGDSLQEGDEIMKIA